MAVSIGEDGETIVEEDAEGDLCGHGTACAGIVRELAPDARIHSVRVLGAGSPARDRCCSPACAGRSSRGST